jgi:hypothetical protein
MTQQLDCTISIASTQNNGIHHIHFCLHKTFNILNCSAGKQKHEYNDVWGIHCTTSQWNQPDKQISCKTSSPNCISVSTMTVVLNGIHELLEHHIQRLVQMYPYPHKVSPISDTLQCWTGMPLWLEKSPNLQQYEYGQLVLGNTESTSCGSSKYAWDLCL